MSYKTLSDGSFNDQIDGVLIGSSQGSALTCL